MCEEARGFGPGLPGARRQLFNDEESDEHDEMEDLAQFLIGDEDLALLLEDEDDDLDFNDDDEGYEDEDITEEGSESSSSIEVLSDSGSSIEVLGDYSAYTDEGVCDDDMLYSPYQIMPPQASPPTDWNTHQLYYPPVSPINPSSLPWSPENWTSRDLYSPMSSPATPWPMAGDGPYAPGLAPLDDSCSELPPMYWDVTRSTYKTADSPHLDNTGSDLPPTYWNVTYTTEEDPCNSSFMSDSSYSSAPDSSLDDEC